MSEETTDRTGRGFWGRILHVDLSARKHEYEDLSPDFYRKYLGGVGLGAKVLWDRMEPGAGPLGPENVLGFTTGLLTDTGSLFTGRFTVVGKSPQTGGWGDANCGGHFSPFLKRCGIDAAFFHGAADRPVYVYLDDQGVQIRDAAALWGLDAIETEKQLKEEHGKTAQVACLGPAGEKRSLLAGISTDGGRYAARSGLGAVMGAKKLKAVVAAGKNRVGVADPERMKRLTQEYRQRLEGGKFFQRILKDGVFGFIGRLTRIGTVYTRQPADMWRHMLIKFGTPSLTAFSAEDGDSPIKNWGGVGYVDFPLRRSQKIGAEAVIRYEVKKYGCYSCPLRCGGIMEVQEGPWPVAEMHKPEYETICAFGSLCLNDDLLSIMKVNDICNRGGVDTISCGAVVAFAIECFENGILTPADTGGLELRWGASEAIVRLTEMIVRREGLGDVLADGVRSAAQRIGRGAEKFAVHCGGVEAPMHDPKFDPGQASSYLCEPTPGRHTIASLLFLDVQLLEKKFARARKIPAVTTNRRKHAYGDWGEALAVDSFYKMLVDCAGVCLFGTQAGGNMPLCEWLDAATGWVTTPDDYLEVGERVELLRHAFNVREGLNPARDFQLHPRVYGDPPLTRGPAKNVTIDLDTMARATYAAMKWDFETGRPERGHLEKMGLSEVAAALYPEGA
ncbi:MAG: aldehyde ferredoxin oxidoreductase family protein [Thermodesulfobacteriota bacterium]